VDKLNKDSWCVIHALSCRIPMMQLEMNWTVLPRHTERMAERSKILAEYRSKK